MPPAATCFVSVGTTEFGALIELVSGAPFAQTLADAGFSKLVVQFGRGEREPDFHAAAKVLTIHGCVHSSCRRRRRRCCCLSLLCAGYYQTYAVRLTACHRPAALLQSPPTLCRRTSLARSAGYLAALAQRCRGALNAVELAARTATDLLAPLRDPTARRDEHNGGDPAAVAAAAAAAAVAAA
eukprot:SAG31_NODE_12457_length_940_cov_1.206897_1_plen_183_part_00